MEILTVCFFLLLRIETLQGYDVISYITPEMCNKTSYFDSLSHQCKPCGKHQLADFDHLSCKCEPSFYLEFNERTKRNECFSCDAKPQKKSCLLANLTCDAYDIKVLNGSGNETVARCQQCPLWHQPDTERVSCVPCRSMCNCPSGYEDLNGTCVEDGNVVSDAPGLYTLFFQGKYHVSNYLRQRIRPSAARCKNGDGQACEELANLCCLVDYNFDSQSACSLHRQLSSALAYPSMYFDEARNYMLLKMSKIFLHKDRPLEFVVKRYKLDGTYDSIHPLDSVFNSMCCISEWRAFQRNTNIYDSCALYPKNFTASEMRFFELYFVDATGNRSNLINVPVRVSNLVRGGVERNKESDMSRWQLTRRFYNFDIVTVADSKGRAEFIRHLSSLTISLSSVPEEITPTIRIPYATVIYDKTQQERYSQRMIKFKLENVVSMEEAIRAIEISLGVLSAIAALYTFLRIFIWYKRSDKTTIDLLTLIRLVIYGADFLANVIFIVVFFATFYWLVTFRQQEEVTISLPSKGDELFIKDLVIASFTLKAASILWMIGEQCTVDIFLLDWENPRPSTDDVVSVWRMYFVANEWNELQVTRKSSPSVQVIATLLFLEVFNCQQFTYEFPLAESAAKTQDNSNTILRFALGCVIYFTVSIAQNLWSKIIVERYIENKIERFTDLCTLANISVWLLPHTRYGFYIHGRSPHGFADIDMPTMCQQLQREEENLCAQRGLIQGQDVQTFSLHLSKPFLEKWIKLHTATPPSNQSNNQNSLYTTVNQYLTSFLDHALKDVDYEVRDRNILEILLDVELQLSEPIQRTILYNDNRNSFDSMLLYGNETSLVSFEALLFCLVDMYCHSYLTAGVCSYIVSKTLEMVRYRLGRRNLAKKTFIDSRFLF